MNATGSTAGSAHRFVWGAHFWADVAQCVLQRDDPAAWTVVVPALAHAALLRAALADAMLRAGRGAMFPPRILTVQGWAAELATELVPAGGRADTSRRVELFGALRETEWLAAALSGGNMSKSTPLWALSRQLMGVCDELTRALAVPDAATDVETRLLALIKGSYRDRAWDACSAEAELLIGIWRAALARDEGPALQLRALQRIVSQEAARTPLLVVAAERMAPHERAFLARYAEEGEVQHVVVDVEASLLPALQSAWPELLPPRGESFAAPPTAPLRERAAALRDLEATAPHTRLRHLGMVAANGLEDEAVCAASRILEWLEAGRSSIALVALDVVVARRVRALLERADVLVRDETGWKFSTTSAAGALMRWLEIVDADPGRVESATLLDWIKSPFTWSDVADKAALVAEIETAIRAANVVRGWAGILEALTRSAQRLERDGEDSHTVTLRSVHLAAASARLTELRAQAQPLDGRHPLARHFEWLAERLEATGMQTALAEDRVGAAMLAQFAALADEVGSDATRFRYDDWRDFVSDALENTTFRDASVESPVVGTSLDGIALRPFDCIVMVGADAAHLPAEMTETLLLTPALRAELGLANRDARGHDEALGLALTLSAASEVLITWQAHRDGDPNPLAPPLERLSLLHKLAFGDDLRAAWAWPRETVEERPIFQPAPSAVALVPARLSASGYNLFQSCPYRYFARYMLKLQPLDDVSDEAEKRDYGNLVHEILERFHGELAQPEAVDAMVARLRRISAEVFDAVTGSNPAYLGYRQRFSALAPAYADWWTDWYAQGWRFDAAELAREVALPLEDGRSLTLHGRLDRIDRQAVVPGIAIIDYKARSKAALKATLAEPGEDVQLPFYRLLMNEEEDVSALYLSVDRGEVDAVGAELDMHMLSGAVAQRIVFDFSRLHDGAALPANGADRACAHCDARGLCRKGYWDDTVREEGA